MKTVIPKRKRGKKNKHNKYKLLFLGVSGFGEPKPERVTKASLKRARRALKLERIEQKNNLMKILFNSNANPIKFKDITGIKCAYCPVTMTRAQDLKDHFVEMHRNEDFLQSKMQAFSKNVVRLDITDLKCEICDQEIDTLEALLQHFKSIHYLDVNTDVDNIALPFRFDGKEMRCVYCLSNFPVFKMLREHMNVHFRKFLCDICDAGFISSELLYRHKLRHTVAESICHFCAKVFSSKDRLKRHEQTVHYKIKKNKCNYCDERFEEFNQKLKHMNKVHNKNLDVSCSICDKEFVTPREVRKHVRTFHMMEKTFECSDCDKSFFSKSQLRSHEITHNLDKLYQCGECFKTFARLGSLRTHMNSHDDERKFQCDFCLKTFVQKIGLKRHLDNLHGHLFKIE